MPINEDRSAATEFEEANSVDVVLSKVNIMGEKVKMTRSITHSDSCEPLDSIKAKGLSETATLNSKPEKTHSRTLKVGDRERVSESAPLYYWGSESHEIVGIILCVHNKDGEKQVLVDFPTDRIWTGELTEIWKLWTELFIFRHSV